MARIRYFHDCTTNPEKMANINHSGAVSSAAKEFSGDCPGCGQRVQADRFVEFKNNPSLHKCSARCQNAKGHICECSCGGARHGHGGN